MNSITVIIPARNEERNLPACLRSVDWAEKVYVVDSNSNDLTLDICRQYGAELVQFDYDGGWPKKKNWAIRNLHIATEWIFILDADERVTEDLHREICEKIEKYPDVAGFYMRWKFVFLGRWMRRSWNHGWMLRLFRKGSGEYEDLGMRTEGGWDNEVHENIIVSGKTMCLESWLLHESEETLSSWIRKQNDYSDWNSVRRVRQMSEEFPGVLDLFSRDPLKRRKFLKRLYLVLPFKPFLMFFFLYIIKFGFLDGREGFIFCALRGIHEFNINAKVFELKKPMAKEKI